MLQLGGPDQEGPSPSSCSYTKAFSFLSRDAYPCDSTSWVNDYFAYVCHSCSLSTSVVCTAAGRPRPGGGITLKLLIDEGILFPGENCLTVEYKSNITYGSLAECGRIKCTIAGRELTFESPSAFSIYLKRLINPARKADDGWKTVKFEGKVRIATAVLSVVVSRLVCCLCVGGGPCVLFSSARKADNGWRVVGVEGKASVWLCPDLCGSPGPALSC